MCLADVLLRQRATAEKSKEKTAIPELLATLALAGCSVTIDAMGTRANIAQAIRDRGADDLLAVKDNQPTLADSLRDFFAQFKAAPEKTPHSVTEPIEKDHGRLETGRCNAFDQLPCLDKPEQWADLQSFAVIEAEHRINGKTSLERRFYISSLPAVSSPPPPTSTSLNFSAWLDLPTIALALPGLFGAGQRRGAQQAADSRVFAFLRQ